VSVGELDTATCGTIVIAGCIAIGLPPYSEVIIFNHGSPLMMFRNPEMLDRVEASTFAVQSTGTALTVPTNLDP
jgi:hypothetical protein